MTKNYSRHESSLATRLERFSLGSGILVRQSNVDLVHQQLHIEQTFAAVSGDADTDALTLMVPL